ncbi:DNA polymerase I [Spiroplasma turonicum]|uniref:DNA polymerase I n=1 Tax=Spiroplasma turonicum TaxID=216946 RepID=A0A0K1P547_9MOLU|nr:DNA polymerase I [Spiroplasma turonicum]AKU79410.1 DNA polymerase I [Spiroplasma turonicum]ALX70431.1 DNA polymerase I [Spiroplasma turonicum]
MEKYLLVDGNSLLFRAFYSSFGRVTLTTTSGLPTNAVYSFINMLFNLNNNYNYDCILVAFDKGKKTFRHDKLPSYKEGRQKTPPELVTQFPIVREFLSAAKISWYEIENYEADDIIGTMSKKLESKDDVLIHILTSDQDMYQLISDKTFILSPQTGTSDLIIYDKNQLKEKWGISPEQVTDYKGLRGDQSDNIKGVPGIGEKTAKELLNEFENLESIYENIDKIKGAKKVKLETYKEDAFLSKEIATIFLDVNIDFNLHCSNIDYESLKPFLQKYEMNSLVKKYCLNLIKEEDEPNVDYKVVNEWNDSYSDYENSIYIELLNDNYHLPDVVGFSISNSKGNFYFDNIGNDEVNLFNWKQNRIDEGFQKFLLNNKFNSYDIKKTIITLNKLGYKVNDDNFIYDMMLASYVLNSGVKSNFESHTLLIKPDTDIKTFEEVFGKGAKKTKEVDNKLKQEYLVKKSVLIKDLKQLTLERLSESQQLELYQEIELPFSKVLISMELEGILIDKAELNNQSINILDKINELELVLRNAFKDYIDSDFNINSPKQLKELLYDKLNLPDLNKGSTDKETLEKLVDYNNEVEKILLLRKYQKLYSTYLKGFEKYIYSDKKIHTIFNQTLTTTGRLSSVYPNIQNISIRDEMQKEFRKIFICEEGFTFLSFDYSQIELRVLADVANVSSLLTSFKNNKDIHEEAARKIFGLDDNVEVSKDMRRIAKTFNFGILYGLSDFGLAKDLNISIKEAKEFITSYYESFPEILDFKKQTIDFAKKNLFVSTMANRRRYIHELQSSNFMIKQFGERAAVNAVIQGTAADILKVAMINIFKNYKSDKNIKMIAQIHDEIIFIIKESLENDFIKSLESYMLEAYDIILKSYNNNRESRVKLEVNYSKGKNWLLLK